MTHQLNPLARVALVDPPWQGSNAEKHYRTESLDWIKALPIADLMHADSWCFLWITGGMLWHGPDVLRAWGFEPVKPPMIVWFKGFTGTGQPLRASTEYLLLGRRGRPGYAFKGQPTHLIAPRARHSEKPAEQIALIERLVGGDGPFIEIFARKRPSSSKPWRIWGLEAEGGSDFAMPGHPLPNDPEHREELTE
ncbi:MT-A70 family methyltransferase [Pseudolysinimonas sp.]|jgi:N6-adenosine-specific RNA methylase IME4|uniref:MT-A70 family methyltransferase n=1 Tax=Pseudolysinimonas sp. TaxID=2680009 RepID=UPI0037832AC0